MRKQGSVGPAKKETERCRSTCERDGRIAAKANDHVPDGDREEHLFIYAVVRADLEMPAGKLAAQAGHAFTDSLFDCLDKRPDLAARYRRGDNAGSKAALKARGENALARALEECRAAGIPHALVVDSNHVLPSHFDGSPVVTALGIGPVSRKDARPLVKRFSCV